MFKWCFLDQACSATSVQLSRHETVANVDTSIEETKVNTISNEQMPVSSQSQNFVIEAGTSGCSDVNIVEPMATGTSTYICPIHENKIRLSITLLVK